MGNREHQEGQVLLERERELEELDAALRAAREGHGRLVLVEGHAGIGKSRLLEAAVADWRAAGAGVLTARGAELEREFAFGVAVQLFEPAIARLEPAERARVLSGAAELAAPLLGERTLSDPDPGAASRLHGLFWLASNLAAERPLLLAIDDAHWADESSLRALLYMAQRVEDLPVVILATARPRPEVGSEHLATELAALPSARVLALAPLGDEAAGRLVRARLPAADEPFCRACAEATGGNPFLLGELSASLADEGIRPVAGEVGRLGRFAPESVSRSLLARLARLPDAAAALARAVALLGDDASPRTAAGLAGLEPETAAVAADDLVAADLLRPGLPLRYTHALVRSAVYADLPALERRLAHARAARLLLDEGAPVEQVAAQLLLAEPGDRDWAVEALVEAAHRASAKGAPASAAAYLQRALDEPPAAHRHREVLFELGRAEAAAGAEGALGHLERAAEASAESVPRAEALLALGEARWRRGLPEEAAAALARGLEGLDGEAPELAARLELSYLTVARTSAPLRGAVAERLERWLAGPARDEGPAGRMLAAHLALERAFAGEPRDGVMELVRRALGEGSLLRAEGPDSPTFYVLVGALRPCDEIELEERVLGEAIEEARRRGSETAFASASYCRAWPLYYRGELLEAMADAEQAIAASEHGWKVFLAAARTVLALCLLERGALAEAEEALAPHAGLVEPTSAGEALLLDARGRIHLARGRVAEALTDFEGAGRAARAFRVDNPGLMPWRSQLALALRAAGRAQEGAAGLDEEVALARRFGAPRALGAALRARGLTRGGPPGLADLEEASAVLEASPSGLERARALVELGGALRRVGRAREARAPLRAALDLATPGGVTLLEQGAREELEAAGAPAEDAHRTTVSGLELLTPSERRIAQRVARGMSNGEIAEALFVTIKTVGYHLGNIYGKLELGSRPELVAAFGEDEAAG